MKTPKNPTPETPDPVVLENPAPEAEAVDPANDMPDNVWLHGLMMLIVAVLLRVAAALVSLAAFIQFLWMLIAKRRNDGIKEFGAGLANWMAKAGLFLGGKSDEKPFPWTAWK